MSAKKQHRYTVEGVGLFPIDMLRYDGAWPATAADGLAIHASLRARPPHPATRRIQLISNREPTTARWQSYHWRVVEVAS
jgi:hypothetical protein